MTTDPSVAHDHAERAELERRLAAMARLPDENPNPVLRIAESGDLVYHNRASVPIVEALGLRHGEPVPATFLERIRSALADGADASLEVELPPRTYSLKPVAVADLGSIALFGTDITAVRAVARFPDRNPNPVMRISEDGALLYANAASRPIALALALELGRPLPDGLRRDLLASAVVDDGRAIEVTGGGILGLGAARRAHPGVRVHQRLCHGRDGGSAHRAGAPRERATPAEHPAGTHRRPASSGEQVIADRHEDLSLLIADIVGFTQLSSRMTPDEVVHLLNHLFNGIDSLVERYGLEKIKTIGDAYMVVGGLPPETDDHLARLAGMALDLTDLLRAGQQLAPVTMRIGVHAGPAVAGVIGTRKFVYDVWGSTVNVASRLELYGVPGEVQVSEVVQQRLADRFAFVPRGVMDLKGVGAVSTWFLRARATTA